MKRAVKFVPVIAAALLIAVIKISGAQSPVIPTRTEVSSSANPVSASQTLTITARVNPVAPSPNAPSGALQFYDANVLLGAATLAQVNGVATAVLSNVHLDPGSHPLIAKYAGDEHFGASDSVPPLPQRVTAP